MHLDNFEIEIRAEELRGFARQPEQGVHADAVVGGEDDGQCLGCFTNGGELFIGVTGGADDHALLLLEAFAEQFVAKVV